MSAPDGAPVLATVAILALPEVAASMLFGMSDMFMGVGRDWPLVVEDRALDGELRQLIQAIRDRAWSLYED